MAEQKDEAEVDNQRVEKSHSFVEVICKCTGKTWRFAAGTEAKFALHFINSSSVDSILANQPATYIEAVKDGEVPVIFGPNSILVNYGKGWKLQPVTKTRKSFSRGKPDDYAAARPAYIPLIVHFRALEKPEEDDFCLELAKSDTYDEVVERVAQRLGVDDPSKIRLTPHNYYSQQPKPSPIKYRSVDHLVEMLIHYNQISDILYYEVLDIPLPELQCLKTLKVAFHHCMKYEIETLNVRLPKQSTVGCVLNEIKSKVELSHPNAELRLLEVFYHKIYKIFPLSEKIENINDQYWTLRAEEIPEEEKNLGPHDRLIHVYHFTRETSQNQMQVQNFGEPFVLVIHEGETLAEIKVRIQKKLQVSDEEFSKVQCLSTTFCSNWNILWKFAFLSLGRPEYLQDSVIVSSCFQRRDVYGDWEQYLGLEHADTTSKRPYVNQNCHTFEKPFKIYD